MWGCMGCHVEWHTRVPTLAESARHECTFRVDSRLKQYTATMPLAVANATYSDAAPSAIRTADTDQSEPMELRPPSGTILASLSPR